jgi:hypothetical protein
MTLRAGTALLFALASLTPRLAEAQTVAIDTTTRFQTMDGFGPTVETTIAGATW